MNKLLFPNELLPICSIPKEVLGPACLASYLLFTRTLEIALINPQFARIACNQLPWHVSAQHQKQAFIFYLEEAEHAQGSQELLDRFFPDFNFAEYQSTLPKRVYGLMNKYKKEERGFFEFTCFIASECLISQNLVRISLDTNVHPTVREYVIAHATEEARHRSFCLELLREVSKSWTPSQKWLFLKIARDFSKIFLDYDEELLKKITRSTFLYEKNATHSDKTLSLLNNTLSGVLA